MMLERIAIYYEFWVVVVVFFFAILFIIVVAYFVEGLLVDQVCGLHKFSDSSAYPLKKDLASMPPSIDQDLPREC